MNDMNSTLTVGQVVTDKQAMEEVFKDVQFTQRGDLKNFRGAVKRLEKLTGREWDYSHAEACWYAWWEVLTTPTAEDEARWQAEDAAREVKKAKRQAEEAVQPSGLTLTTESPARGIRRA